MAAAVTQRIHVDDELATSLYAHVARMRQEEGFAPQMALSWFIAQLQQCVFENTEHSETQSSFNLATEDEVCASTHFFIILLDLFSRATGPICNLLYHCCTSRRRLIMRYGLVEEIMELNDIYFDAVVHP